MPKAPKTHRVTLRLTTDYYDRLFVHAARLGNSMCGVLEGLVALHIPALTDAQKKSLTDARTSATLPSDEASNAS